MVAITRVIQWSRARDDGYVSAMIEAHVPDGAAPRRGDDHQTSTGLTTLPVLTSLMAVLIWVKG